VRELTHDGVPDLLAVMVDMEDVRSRQASLLASPMFTVGVPRNDASLIPPRNCRQGRPFAARAQ